MSNCQVCCENIRYNVSCPKCNYNCCRVCVRTYLCGQLTEPHCMSCKTKWNLDFVEISVGTTFFKNDFKKSQSNTYYEFEKTQLPLVQENIKEFLFNEKKEKTIEILTKENKKHLIGKYGCFNCVGSIYYNEECNICDEDSVNEIKTQRNNVCNYLYFKTTPSKITPILKDFKINKNKFWNHNLNSKGFYCECGSRLDMTVKHITHTNDKQASAENDKNDKNDKNDIYYYTCVSSRICFKKYCAECFGLLDNKDHSHKNNNGKCMNMRYCPCVKYTCDKCTIDINKSLCSVIRSIRFNQSSAEETERKKFIMKCQATNCVGFISTQYKCGVCESFTCPECLEIKLDDDHVCKPDSIESVKMIKKETRPCPNCATRIYKIDGCDQMWCVDCKTAFSWNTGQISNSKIHNPHYYEYLRQTQGSVPRDPADVPGGGCAQFPTAVDVRICLNSLGKIHEFSPDILVNNETLNILNNKVKNLYSIFVNNVNEFHKFINEVEALIGLTDVDLLNNQIINCRVLHSLNRMDVDTFKRTIYMYHQKTQHHNHFVHTMRMFIQICKDIFGFVLDIIKNLKNLNSFKSELANSTIESRIDTKTIQYSYLLELNNHLNDNLKQLMNSIEYINSNLPKNKYYTNECDKFNFIIRVKPFTDDELGERYQFGQIPFIKNNVLPYMIKWNDAAYCFELRYSNSIKY